VRRHLTAAIVGVTIGLLWLWLFLAVIWPAVTEP
jgi:hypothetical protein